MPGILEQELLLLARDLLLLYDEVAGRLLNVPAQKAATRRELFRRVEVAREYMHAHGDGKLSLEDAARAACLSPYHFHRTFMQVWGKTPHEYVTQLRLSRARAMLESGLPVADAASAIGFESVSSFSRLFRSVYGTSPGRIRKIGHSQNAQRTLSSAS
jgi:transcriptional regulator GlxA family with amidase domain